MSNNDTELFDLCKAVYEATGWDDCDLGHKYSHDGTYPGVGRREYPLYTSDYLLDKLHLTNRTDRGKYHIGIIVGRDIHGNKAVSASAQDTGWIIQEGGDTLLIALLKLTLTLHKQERI